MKAKLLIVDDDISITRYLFELLDDEYDIKTARSGKMAMFLGRTFLPDIMLLDIVIPEMDGYEVCRQCRKDLFMRETKIICLSMKSEICDKIKAYDAGADDYITKPFDPSELKKKLKAVTRSIDSSSTILRKIVCEQAENLERIENEFKSRHRNGTNISILNFSKYKC